MNSFDDAIVMGVPNQTMLTALFGSKLLIAIMNSIVAVQWLPLKPKSSASHKAPIDDLGSNERKVNQRKTWSFDCHMHLSTSLERHV